jgi:hypothetical protein
MADAGGDALAAWRELGSPACAPLLDALRGIDAAPAPAVIERLRREHGAGKVTAAIELSIARTRAAAKFGAAATALWADRRGVEMASAPHVAAWKAERFAREGGNAVDLCCGIGGDLAELARRVPATGVDLDPLRAWMAAQNAGVPTECADATARVRDEDLAHADPARRDGGDRRIVRSVDLLPPLAEIRRVTARCRGTAVKLGPGMDLDAAEVRGDGEVEFISDGGQLVQQVLWTGTLASHAGRRTATRLGADGACTVSGLPQPAPPTDLPGAFGDAILVPDPALERARLLGMLAAAHALAEPAPGLGVLTASGVPAHADVAAWFERFTIIEELPAREPTVAAWLAARGAGIVTVRTRGGACDPDAWQRAMRGPGDEPWTVFVLRLGEARRAFAVRRA